ncbi:MAG: hypothetical protein KAU06_04805 [Candidatus Marinimicrobia bacterium]|nr:hypothetical protein [Candidatus Neomarinimicrobiota bacterium]
MTTTRNPYYPDGHLRSYPSGEGWRFVINTKDKEKGLRWGKNHPSFEGYEFIVTSPAYDKWGKEHEDMVAIWARKPIFTEENQ